ncbi:MAG: beta-ketoacyl-[acyl-carrier-protein] synthase family protein [Proteobacteria bacterium]|nr:beta-ketoacyl-[acyl-carrier-protein] synthase family protein [Pseudomonadota bacterium]MBU1581702.1 beta-ketoacyl-[acyl-carrier-protein] synthase family protein [Pseudomonadota bacterium]MBU2455447.1 beta-ketoacyl-[acyl-carrier-protein] synthase family protein [Pseudomonadota bacterium]
MTPVCITKACVITSLGPDLHSLYNGLTDQKSGISTITRFNTQCYASPFGGIIPDLDHTKKSSLIFQLSDLLIDQLGEIENDTFLISASTKAGIDMLGKKIAEPEICGKNLLLSDLTEYIALKLKLKNKGININSACASSTIAVAKGAALIQRGVVDSVLICCMDIVSEFVFSGFSALGAMSDEPAKPFDKHRNGLTLGEGAAAILLMSEKRARSQGLSPLCRIAGWGIANDATHLTAPAKDGYGLKLAITTACKKAGILPEHIPAVNTHGTGTAYNDAMELTVLHAMFNPDQVIANSIKGAIGHTLGAAGGIEIALCVKMLLEGMMPGTFGFLDPGKGAEKVIYPDARPIKGDCILTTNSGFGGINAAVILKKA